MSLYKQFRGKAARIAKKRLPKDVVERVRESYNSTPRTKQGKGSTVRQSGSIAFIVIRESLRSIFTKNQRFTKWMSLGVGPHRLIANRVSIVLPAYNVEEYIGECLASIAAQTYRNIDVLVVLDGCTDGTEKIVRDFAADHPFVRWIAQENRGLSAARNVGARMARGEYLWFIDSDDVIPPNAAELMVQSLQSSGSDFAVANYYRFNTFRRWDPASWIMRVHQQNRRGITLEQMPEILCNAVACSKVFRTRFWRENKFMWPEGMLYEDQEVTAKAYTKARKFDILHDQLYGWRVRENGTSISQQVNRIEDLQARLRAIRMSIANLQEAGATGPADVRLLQFLNNDFRHSLTDPDAISQEYWDTLRAALQEFTADLPSDVWARISPRPAALEWLVLQNKKAEAYEYLYQDAMNPNTMRTTWHGDDLIAMLPYWDDPEVNYPESVLVVPDQDIEVEVSLRGASWSEDYRKLTITGWAYIKCIDLSENEEDIAITLVSKNQRIPLPVKRFAIPEADERASHHFNDYTNSGFRIVVDLDRLDGTARKTDWSIEVTVICGSIAKAVHVQKMNRWSSALHTGIGTTPGGVQARIRPPQGANDVAIEVIRPEFTVQDVQIVGNKITGTVVGRDSRRATPLQIVVYWQNSSEAPIAQASLKAVGQNLWAFQLPIPPYDQWPQPKSGTEDKKPDLYVRVRTDTSDFALAWPEAPLTAAEPIGTTGVALARSVAGNFSVWAAGELRLGVDETSLTSEGLSLSGHAISERRDAQVCLFNTTVHVTAPVVWADAQKWSAVLPLTADLWGRGERVLPSGAYQVGASLTENEEEEGTQVDPVSCLVFGQSIGFHVPMTLDTDHCLARFELTPGRRGQVVVEPTLKADERGQRAWKLGQSQIPFLGASGLKENTILLRSYYGEVANCNPYGVHQAIRRMGADLRIVWGVKDLSVPVPDGGIPILSGSKEWYEMLATAKYQVWNVHQPDFYRKNPGQIIVETFHGYPFKLAGVPYWSEAGFSSLRVRSYMERQAEWDYLVSPAPYATPLLEECFPGAREMLEIGYPRNDIFFDPARDEIRARTRALLGVPDGTTAVLYAPTFRDWLSDNEVKAKISEFLDPASLAERLGPDYMILMRGHPMEGRGGDVRQGGAHVVDVTSYPLVEELCLASDVGVMDYSSLRFDYALTGNPVLYFVPDLEQYLHQERGSLIPYEGTAPGPWCQTLDELVDALVDVDAVGQEYHDARNLFIKDFLPLEDGKAGERLIQTLLSTQD